MSDLVALFEFHVIAPVRGHHCRQAFSRLVGVVVGRTGGHVL